MYAPSTLTSPPSSCPEPKNLDTATGMCGGEPSWGGSRGYERDVGAGDWDSYVKEEAFTGKTGRASNIRRFRVQVTEPPMSGLGEA